MGLFGRSNEIVLDHGHASRRSGLPGWLIWLVTGLLIGTLGILWLQDRFAPPRLSAEESRQVQAERDKAQQERREIETRSREAARQVQARLDAAAADVARAREDADRRSAETAAATETIERLRSELALFEAVMPPDPRGNPVGVRAARIERDNGALTYHVLLTRDAGTEQPFAGVMQLVVKGQRTTGATDTVTLGPIPVRVGSYQHVRGSERLPKGFDPRQTSIQVLDRPDGSSVGMRIIHVQ